ncbi:hypothetical protein [Bradyrhizobium quebecense]|uniref:Uncharacterized protein n=2 Tax=Bradyrhizobium quebecense TaxID=2748629 RepID=A0ACD3VCA2_9BRAD|nr:hypothetical protein [Bradyrhizobium quebecense]UGY04063.1 hypothetical protein J4P68_0004670 [Bradyrhizobium quebecense]
MTINVKAYANADDVLIAWQPDTWSNDWVGFQLERRNNITQQTTVLSNRIPPNQAMLCTRSWPSCTMPISAAARSMPPSTR